MPVDRYMARKQRTTKVHFALIGGPEADTSPGVTPVLDSNNVVPSPNGTEMSPRDGIEIRKRYRLTTDTPGRKALVVETAPPDVALGYLFMIVDTANGANQIEKGQFMRDRTQIAFGALLTYHSFQDDSGGINVGMVGEFRVERTGITGVETIVRFATRDGTAVAGVDYDTQTGALTFTIDSILEVISLNPPLGGAGKFFFIDLFNPTPTGATFGAFKTIVVNIFP